MRGHFVGDLVPFQDVSERIDGETHGIGDVHEHVDLILSVAVTSHKPFLIQNLSEGFQFQILSGGSGHGVVATGAPAGVSHLLIVLLPRLIVFTGAVKMVVVYLLYAHSRLRKTRAVIIAPIALLHILSKGKLDEWRGAFKQQLLRGCTPSELDDGALTANGIG